MSAGGICLAHLVRKANDLAAFRAFVDSYRRYPAGAAHELLVIFKGFAQQDALSPYEDILQGLPHRKMFVPDTGYDIGPYLQVAQDYEHAYFVFLNSFSRIRVAGWLEMLYRHATRAGVGIVGATGSHQSNLSDYYAFQGETRRTLPLYKRALLPLHRYARFVLTVRGRFPPFPNHHIRTNAFMMARDLLRAVRAATISGKWDAYDVESGVNSVTRQMLAAGRSAFVVGADGRAYEPPDWPLARAYWISGQENLLVDDNQTRVYEEGGPIVRERLAFHAWRRYPDGTPRSEAPPLPENVLA